ncbi:MAG: hypothetical protein D6744_06145 [Planctomycetota bacterium]|nr:MAG: hypothetical protein D6744_06145 [Planctomycetota bacterium]
MMKQFKYMCCRGWTRVLVPGGSIALLGGCGLSDQQLSTLFATAVSTGLNTLVTQAIAALFGGLTGTGA